jgi:iron complex transport system substrate-binding protein
MALGIPVYAAEIESLDDVVSTIDRVGTLLGLGTAADSLISSIESGLEAVRSAVSGRVRPDIFYMIGHSPPMTAGPGTFIDELIGIAGGRNLFADSPSGWPLIALEEIVRRQPDLLIVPFGEGNAALEQLIRLPGWRELDAVRAGRVYSVDAEIAHRPGPRVAEVARIFAGLIHPEVSIPEPAR